MSDDPQNRPIPDAIGPDPDREFVPLAPAPDEVPVNAWEDDNDFDDDGDGCGMLAPIPPELAG